MAAGKRRFFASRADVVGRRVAVAVERGQLPAGTDPLRLQRTPIAPIYLSLLVTDQPITEDD